VRLDPEKNSPKVVSFFEAVRAAAESR